MGNATPMFGVFDAGMRRDRPRDQMNPAAAWNLVDYVPNILGAPIEKRGPWEYFSSDIALTNPTAEYVVAGAWAPFTGGAKNCAIDEDGSFYTISVNGTVTHVSTPGVTPRAPLPFHRDTLVIPADDGTTAPFAYSGAGTPATLGGTPPAGTCGAVHKDRTLLANTLATPQRIFFSGAGDPAQWNTTVSWLDATYPVVALASIQNSVLVFSHEITERIRGSIPPPGTDMSMDTPFYGQGCIDARSVLVVDGLCWWCDEHGVYVTDGAETDDVTVRGGFKGYWLDMTASITAAWTFTGFSLRNFYGIAVNNGSTFVDAFLIDRNTRVWTRIANLPAVMCWSPQGTADETYFAALDDAKVGSLSTLFDPSAGPADGNGQAVTPVWETAYVPIGQSKSRITSAYLTYDLRDAGTAPTMALGYVLSPEETTYTAATDRDGSDLTIPATTERTYTRRWVRSLGHGAAFQVTQTNASSRTRVYGLGLDARLREASRVAY